MLKRIFNNNCIKCREMKTVSAANRIKFDRSMFLMNCFINFVLKYTFLHEFLRKKIVFFSNFYSTNLHMAFITQLLHLTMKILSLSFYLYTM